MKSRQQHRKISRVSGDCSPEEEASPATMKRYRVWLFSIGVLISLFLSIMDAMIVATSLHAIATEFELFVSVNWVALAYTLAECSCGIVFARVSDVVGRRSAHIAANAIFIVSSMGCGFSKSPVQLIVWRAVQGIGGAGLYSLAMIITQEMCPMHLLEYAVSICGAVIALATVIGPIIGGVLTEFATWRWIFWINCPLCALSVVLVVTFWPAENATTRAERLSWKCFDYIGSALLITAGILTVLAFQNAGESHASVWGSYLFIAPLVTGIASWVALLTWEYFIPRKYTAIDPILPLSVFQNRIYASGVMVTLTLGFPVFMLTFVVPLRGQIVSGKSAVEAAIMLLPMAVTVAVGCAVAGACNAKTNYLFETTLIGACFSTVGCALLTTVADSRDDPKLLGYLALTGFGCGLAITVSTIMVAVEIRSKDAASGQGIIAQARILGGSLSISVSSIFLQREVGHLFGGSGSEHLNASPLLGDQITTLPDQLQAAVRYTVSKAFQHGMAVSAVISGAAILMSFVGYNIAHKNIKNEIRDLRLQDASLSQRRQVRRASLNSLELGSMSNLVAIEHPSKAEDDEMVLITPFVFSASSKHKLREQLVAFREYLERNPRTNPRDLAWTLHKFQSRLLFRVSFPAPSINALCSDLLRIENNFKLDLRLATTKVGSGRILGVFSGQGAQWARMGAEIIENSIVAADILVRLDHALSQLPEKDRPQWKLRDELLASASLSNVKTAALAPVLSTAVQIILVDLLYLAGVRFAAVVGHSSGEIAAAYAAGRLSASDAIGIAYYCGLHSHLAGGIDGVTGAMLAVHMSFQEGQQLCNADAFRGKLCIAACNSPSSITFSGDENAISELETIMKASKRYMRRLPVAKAYHSHHMLPCTQRYVESLKFLSGRGKWVDRNSDWVSSVYPDRPLSEMANLDGHYWVQNILSTVLFSQAIERALRLDPFDAVVEVGPHPVLKGHIRDTSLESVPVALPYTGLLQRNRNANQTFAGALGYLWARVGNLDIDFEHYERAVTGLTSYSHISDLPVLWDAKRGSASDGSSTPVQGKTQSSVPLSSQERGKTDGCLQPLANEPEQLEFGTAAVQGQAKESIIAVINELRNQSCDTDNDMIEAWADTNDLGLDSMDAVQLSSWLWNSYQVKIDVVSILAGMSVNEIVEKVLATLSDKETQNTARLGLQQDVKEHASSRRNPESSAYSCDETPLTKLEIADSPMRGGWHAPPAEETPPLEQSSFTKVGKLSHSQSSFMFADRLLEDKSCQTIAFMLRLRGDIRVPQLEEAIHSVGQLHESLRTCIRVHNGQLVQAVLPLSRLNLEQKDLRSKDQVQEEYDAIRRYTFDLSGGKTAVMRLLSLSSQEHYLLVGCHHIMFDRSSFDALKMDLEQAYYGRPRLHAQQYLDYSDEIHDRCRIGAWETSIAFWRESLSPAPLPLPLHRSLVLHRRPLISHKSHEVTFQLNHRLAANIRHFAKSCRSTPFHFHLAVFKVLLHRFLGIGDVCINIVDNCRRTDYMQTGIGPFLNMLPIRLSAESSERFCDAIVQARKTVLLALANAIPLELIVNELGLERHSTHPTVSQALMNYVENRAENCSSFLGCQVDIMRHDESELPYDISFTVVNNKAAGDVSVSLRVQGALYSEESARLIAHGYEDIIQDVLSAPTTPVGSMWQFRPSTLDEALAVGRGSSTTSVWPETLVHRFENILPSVSNRIAAEDTNGVSMTYADLSRQIHCSAFKLSSKGVVPGSRVCIFQYPTVLWVASVMAILKVGAIYVPLDPSTPIARLSFIVNECEPCAILVHDATVQLVEEFHNVGNATIINVSNLSEACPENTLPTLARANSPALILYTSGSSGAPKGVILRHDSLTYEVELCVGTYGVKRTDIVLQQSAWSFDLSVTQLFLAIGVGAKLQIASHRMRADPQAMAEIIKSKGVTITYATPTEYIRLLEHHEGSCRESEWRLGLLGGESVTRSLLQRFQALNKPDLRLFNTYAPTETTCTSTRTELIYAGADDVYRDVVPVGRVSSNESIYILDEMQTLLPCGQVGEIVIGGVGVAAGYLNNDEQTRSAFLSNPFADEEYLKMGWRFMYRTGDVGYLETDGTLVLKGRIQGDTEVKLNGIRINLVEVEQAILQAAGGIIMDTIASVRSFSNDTSQYIVAHVIFTSRGLLIDQDGFMENLVKDLPLPHAMRPSAMMPIDDFPRTTSGKVDRKAIAGLPMTKKTRVPEESRLLSETEITMEMLWKAVIPQTLVELHHIEADSDFFAVGGSSLALIELQSEIQRHFNVGIPLVKLFQSSTLQLMGQLVEAEELGKAKHFDWAAETRLQAGICARAAPRQATCPANKGLGKIVILTGATGYLGQHLLQALVASGRVDKVICLAVRHLTSDRRSLFSRLDKVEVHEGDLELPRLGLSEATAASIFETADVVIHNGADVSLLKTYQSLRSANLSSTQELVRLCLGKKTPLHYISTASVTMYCGSEAVGEGSMRGSPPPTDGLYGYVASKWASEVYLEKVTEMFNISIHIHRPSNIIRADTDMEDGGEETDAMQTMLAYSKRILAFPYLPGLTGYIDLVHPSTVVSRILGALLECEPESMVQPVYIHESGDMQLDIAEIRDYLVSATGEDVEGIPLAKWIDCAKQAGLSTTMAATFERFINMENAFFPKLLTQGRTC